MEMTFVPTKTIIIGVGNPFRADDGAGLAVARLLRAELPPDTGVIEESGEGSSLMDAWRGASRVYLIDAVHSGGPPGTVRRFDASSAAVPTAIFPCSTHGFGVADAIEMARALRELPQQIVVYGIEAASFEQVQGLSLEVQNAVATVARRIAVELREPA